MDSNVPPRWQPMRKRSHVVSKQTKRLAKALVVIEQSLRTVDLKPAMHVEGRALVQSALRSQRAALQISRSVAVVVPRLQLLRPDVDVALADVLDAMSSAGTKSHILAGLKPLHLPQYATAMLHRLLTPGPRPCCLLSAGTLDGLADRVAEASSRYATFVHDRIVQSAEPQDAVNGARQALKAEINCDILPPDARDLCIIVVIGLFVVAVVSWVVDAIKDADTDDRVRDLINRLDCPEISRFTNQNWVEQINVLRDGPTLDEDEDAILKVLGCLECERVRSIVAQIGKAELLWDFDGRQWDKLMIRLRECGIATFAEWDDDTARRFINGADCATLSSLSIDDIRILILKMFDGHTGDEDENAIIRLLQCQWVCTVKEILAMSRTSYSDFDDEVDGAQWRRLRRSLDAARAVDC